MPSDPSSVEDDLRQLRAAALDESLLARLEACADGSLVQLDPAEIQFEQRLRAISPAPLSASLVAALEASVTQVPFPAASPKIVRFPGSGKSSAVRHGRVSWAAAAAVALIGAFAGWHFTGGRSAESLADAAPRAQIARPIPSALVPAGFNRDLSEARDEGVVWQSNQPHRVLKVTYQDRVTLRDAGGRTYQVEQPRVEYILVPAKTD
jgi:hypothetical protein